MSGFNGFNKRFYKDYPFWTIFVTILSAGAIFYFGFHAHKIQSTLKSIETTSQKGILCNELIIYFTIEPSSSNELQEAKYIFKLHNSSSHVFYSLKTQVILYFEDEATKEQKPIEIFTYPSRDLLPSDKPVYLLENPWLTDTIQDNISEGKQNIHDTFQPKYVDFYFEWKVNIGNGEYLNIEKRKDFILEGFY